MNLAVLGLLVNVAFAVDPTENPLANVEIWRAPHWVKTQAHNDNARLVCEALLIDLGRLRTIPVEAAVPLVQSPLKKKRHETKRREVARRTSGLAIIRGQIELRHLAEELPVVTATPRGMVTVRETEDPAELSLDVWRARNPGWSSTRIPRERWLDAMIGASADGRFVATLSLAADHLRVIATRTGEIVLEEEIEREGPGLWINFSSHPRQATVRNGDLIAIYQLHDGGAQLIGGYEIGDPRLGYGPNVSVGALGDVYYLNGQLKFAVSYLGAEPLILERIGGGKFRRVFFARTPGAGVLHQYERGATLSPDGERLASVRVTKLHGHPNYFVEVFDLKRHRHLRTIPVATPVTAVAMLGNALAIGCADRDGVRLYDLTSPSSHPVVKIKTNLERVTTLSLPASGTVIFGSVEWGEIYKVEL